MPIKTSVIKKTLELLESHDYEEAYKILKEESIRAGIDASKKAKAYRDKYGDPCVHKYRADPEYAKLRSKQAGEYAKRKALKLKQEKEELLRLRAMKNDIERSNSIEVKICEVLENNNIPAEISGEIKKVINTKLIETHIKDEVQK